MAVQDENPQEDPLKGIYEDLGLGNEGVKYEDFLNTFKSNKDARKAVYDDLGLKSEGVDYDTFEQKIGIPKAGINPKLPEPSLNFKGAKSVGEYIPDSKRKEIEAQVKNQKPKKPLLNLTALGDYKPIPIQEQVAQAYREDPTVATQRIKAQNAEHDALVKSQEEQEQKVIDDQMQVYKKKYGDTYWGGVKTGIEETSKVIGRGLGRGALNVARGLFETADLIRTRVLGEDELSEADKAEGAAAFDRGDKALGLGLPDDFRGSNPITRASGSLAEFVPAMLSAEATGGMSFAFNGAGTAGKEIAHAKANGAKFENGADDLYTVGKMISEFTLMKMLNSHVLFNKLPSEIRNDLAGRATINAMKALAESSAPVTAESIALAMKDASFSIAKRIPEFLNKGAKAYRNTALDLTALTYVDNELKKKANDVAGSKVLETQSPEQMANSIRHILTEDAPVFAAFGMRQDVGMMFNKSPYKNVVIDAVRADRSPENVSKLIETIGEMGAKQGWNETDIANTQRQAQVVAEAVTKLPDHFTSKQFNDGVDLITGRNDMMEVLDIAKKSKAETLDPVFADIKRPEEIALENKIDQANDKLKELATGKKTKYNFDEEKGEYTKQFGDEKPVKITEERYNLEQVEKPAPEVTETLTTEPVTVVSAKPVKELTDEELTAEIKRLEEEDGNLAKISPDEVGSKILSEPIDKSRFGSVKDFVSDARSVFAGSEETNRSLDFIERVLGDSKDVRFDTEAKLAPEFDGMYSRGEGTIKLNFDHISDKGKLYATGIHELIHAATSKEISRNPAFKKELDVVLSRIRKELKLPDNDAVVTTMIKKGYIEDVDGAYGASNAHELLAEVFSNPKFRDFLSGVKVENQTLLQKLMEIFATWVNKGAKAVSDAKKIADKENVAKYLMSLTESVVDKTKAGRESEFGELAALNPEMKAKLAEMKRELEDRAKQKVAEEREKAGEKLEDEKRKNADRLRDQKEDAQTKEDNNKIVSEEKLKDTIEQKDIEREASEAAIRDEYKGKIEKITDKFTKDIAGIKEDVKDRAEALKDLMGHFAEDIKAQIKIAVKSGVLKGEVRASIVKNLLNKLNNADTPLKLMDAADYVHKTLKDVDYDNKVKTGNSLLGKIKGISKRKNLPANIADAMKNVSRIKVTDASDINKLNAELQGIIDSYKGDTTTGMNTAQMEATTKAINALREDRMKQRYEAVLQSAGVSVPAGSSLRDLQIMIDQMPTAPKSPNNTRATHQAIYEALKPDLDLIDESSLSPRKLEALNALKRVDVDKLDDSMVAELMTATKNAIENGDYSGTIRIINAEKMTTKLADTSLNAKVRSATRVISKGGANFRNKWASVTAQINAITRDRFTLPHLTGATGSDRVRDTFSVFKKRFKDEVVDPLKELADKYEKDLSDNKNQILLSMYADLNNIRSSWSPLEVKAEFDGRKKAIKKSIEVLEKRSLTDATFAKENKEYIANLNEAFKAIENTSDASEIHSLLNNGSKAMYDQATEFFKNNKEAIKENAEIDNNILFEGDWENYFPRQYDNILNPTNRQLSELESLEHASGSTMFSTSVTSKATSGSQKGRIISGEQLPEGRAINFRFAETYMQSAKDALYDIETQASRAYAAFAVSNKRMYEIFGDASGIDVMTRAMVHNVNNQRNVIVGGAQETAVNQILSAYQTLAVRTALGGVFQAFKQAGSAIVESSINLGTDAPLLLNGVGTMMSHTEHANALMDQFAVGRRATDQTFRNKIDVKSAELSAFKKRLKSSFISSGLKVADEVIDTIALGSLKAGDSFGAKVSWLAYYESYQRKQGKTESFDIVKESTSPDMDAAAYAEHMTSLTLNINDASLKPKERITALLAPFASFNINAKINLASNLRRLGQIKDHNSSEFKQLTKAVTANIGSMIFMNATGMGIRYMMIGGSALLLRQLISRDDELTDKEKLKASDLIAKVKEEQIESNVTNSFEYAAKDLIYGGIAAGITDPIYEQAKGALFDYFGWQKPKQFKKTGGIEDNLGIFSVPVRTSMKVWKNFNTWAQSDQQFLMERYGVENAYGENIVLPEDVEDKTRNESIKGLYGLATIAAIVQMTGMSSQEVSAIMSRSVSTGKKLEDELYSKKNKETLNDLKNLEDITIRGKKIVLTDEQYLYRIQKRREFLDQYYKEFEQLYKKSQGKNFDRAEFESKMKTKANRRANLELAQKYEELRGVTILQQEIDEREENDTEE